MEKVRKMKTEPVNVSQELKKFLNFMKHQFKDRSNSFFSDNKTLLYYLEGSERFVKDYSKYLEIQEIIEKEVKR